MLISKKSEDKKIEACLTQLLFFIYIHYFIDLFQAIG